MNDVLHLGFGAGSREAATRWARTQRDAGIEHRQWEGRLRPQLSWAQILTRCAIGAGMALSSALAGARAAGWL